MDNPKLALSVATVCFLLWARREYSERKISSIPAVGASGIWAYYTGGWRYLFRAPEMVEEGCRKYRGRVFRVPRLFRWDFIVSGPTLVQEAVTAAENVLSLAAANRESLQTDLTMGPDISRNLFHIDAVRTKITRNLSRCFPGIRDEISSAFDELLALDENDWKLVTVLPMMMQVAARTTNHLFVGLPICRNQDYLNLVVQYTIDVAVRAQLISLLPSFLQPILGPFISSRNQRIRQGIKHLGPLIEHRIEQEKQHGPDWPGKPNDYISWLLESVNVLDENTVPALVSRILATNMAAIHTTSSVFTYALFDLTAHPTYITALRQEAEQAVEEFGWTKVALNKMHKIDSFLRESQRMHDNGPVAMSRQVLDPMGFKFSDESVIPYGSILNIASRAEHFSPANYDHPDVFDGFRFSKKREDREHTSGGGLFNQHMISTGVDHLAFGHKLHACPGRFLAATELKAMLAHLVVHYDLRAEIEGVRPPDDVFGIVIVPNRRGKLWFRKRQY
ncbi:cytochrome P450 [Mycena olivaceomarginata]|nr:cytochrome P450 [Mycena olivaceomarginata]